MASRGPAVQGTKVQVVMRMANLERCSKVLKQHVNRVEGENQLMNNFQENVSTLFMQGKVFCEGSKTGLLQKKLNVIW